MKPQQIAALKALTDATRLRIAGRIAGSPATVDQLVDELEIRRPDVVRHLAVMRAAGIVADEPDGLISLRRDTLMNLGRDLDGLHRQAQHRAAEPFSAGNNIEPGDAKVLRGFFEDGRLTSIPATESKRLIVLRYLRDQCFVEDRSYPEKEVNQRLALFHPDVAALRRYMVDAGIMTRDSGLYRRGLA